MQHKKVRNLPINLFFFAYCHTHSYSYKNPDRFAVNFEQIEDSQAYCSRELLAYTRYYSICYIIQLTSQPVNLKGLSQACFSCPKKPRTHPSVKLTRNTCTHVRIYLFNRSQLCEYVYVQLICYRLNSVKRWHVSKLNSELVFGTILYLWHQLGRFFLWKCAACCLKLT